MILYSISSVTNKQKISQIKTRHTAIFSIFTLGKIILIATIFFVHTSAHEMCARIESRRRMKKITIN